MSTYKRRIVYLTDDQWHYIRNEAEQQGQTASAWLRDVLESDGRVVPTAKELAIPGYWHDQGTDYSPSRPFYSRPFTPVPKHK